MLLYNLARNVRDRVARASGVLLAAVSWSYLTDIFIGLDISASMQEIWFRLQWLGIGLLPAAMYHLSDALLATTGKISRGRRRKAVRLLYIVGTLFAIAALSTDWLVTELQDGAVPHMEAAWLFPIFVLYYTIASGFAIFNVVRAWRRCRTTYTRRRMSYLMAAFWTPAWGIFPYSLLFSVLPNGLGAVSDLLLWLVFNIANLAVLGMLAFMAYPLAFFGEQKPDRVVRLELLQFMLRGPLTGMVLVAVLQTFSRVEEVLGLDAQAFMTFAAVGTVFVMQWSVTLAMPIFESRLIYTHDQQQARLFQEFSQRLLTRADADQLLEATLAAVCDQMGVPTAFVASFFYPSGPRLEQYVGLEGTDLQELESGFAVDFSNGTITQTITKLDNDFYQWRTYWLVPLQYLFDDQQGQLLGVLGMWARTEAPALDGDEERILQKLIVRAAEILTDVRLQAEILATIEALLPDRTKRPDDAPVTIWGHYTELREEDNPDVKVGNVEASVVNSADFSDIVRDALRYYWGGTKLNESELLQLRIVDSALDEHDGNRVNALRHILDTAIQKLRPEGKQNFTRTDWILYNILDLRFIQGRKVRDTARRLAMSNSDFYRKQRSAIEEVARIIRELELEQITDNDQSMLSKDAVSEHSATTLVESNEIPKLNIKQTQNKPNDTKTP